MPPEILTAEQVADRLNLRPSTIKRWAREHRIPQITASNRVKRFDWVEVADALKSRPLSTHPQ